MQRVLVWPAVVALLAAGCGDTSPDASGAVANVPACASDQIAAQDDIDVTGPTEREAAAVALGEIDDSGRPFASEPDGTWTVTIPGFGTATVIPAERDGMWFIDTVYLCLDRQNPDPVTDGALDCVTDRNIWGIIAEPEPGANGPEDPHTALGATLERYLAAYGGEIVTTGPGTASLVVDGREVVVAEATALDAGGYGISGLEGCDGYDL